MVVKELIELLSKVADPDLAEITFFLKGDNETCFEIERLGQFSIVPDVTITLQEFVPPIIKKAVIRRDKQEMVNETMKKIQEDKAE